MEMAVDERRREIMKESLSHKGGAAGREQR